jgi:integrase/recombinase XerD
MGKVSRSGQAAILSNEQIDRVIAVCRQPYKCVVAIAAFTGCRISEALALKSENLNLGGETITFTVTKTEKPRTVFLHPDLIAMLDDAALPSNGYLFPSTRTAGHVTRQAVDQELRAVLADLGIKGASTHSFRRSLATNLHGKGVPLKAIAAVTGHESLASLSLYIDVTDEQRRSAIMAR